MNRKKGQAVFEFVISTILFFAVIFYILNFLNATIFTFNAEYNNAVLESKSVQVSELLLKDKGKWYSGKPSIVGLASEWPVLNETKIINFNNYCNSESNYINLIDNFNLGRRKFNINVTTDSDTYICGPSVPDVSRSVTQRFGLLEDDSKVRVTVWIW